MLQKFHNQIASSTLPQLQPAVTLLLGLLALLSTVLLGLNTSSNDATTPPVGSSVDYRYPGYEEQMRLETIKTDINAGIKSLRDSEFEYSHTAVGPVVMDLDLQRLAQQKAESNAVEGREPGLDRNVAMVQAHMPAKNASGRALLQQWLDSNAHSEVLVDPRHTFYGIGAAYSDDFVWVVVLFSAT